MNLYQETGTLTPVAPFDFAQTLKFLGLFTPMRAEQDLAGQTLTKALLYQGQIVIFRLHSVGTIDAPQLAYQLFAPAPLTPEQRAGVLDRISFFLSLEDDLNPFYALADADPVFSGVVKQLYGYHQVKFLTPFENAAWAILSQRNMFANALKMKGRLVEALGTKLELEGVNYAAFPEAGHVAAQDVSHLTEILHHRTKAEWLQGVAVAFAGVEESFLREAPYATVLKWLRGIKGIGAWSSTFIMIRSLGHMENLPAEDENLNLAFHKQYGGTGQIFQQVAAQYADQQGYWAHYLRVVS